MEKSILAKPQSKVATETKLASIGRYVDGIKQVFERLPQDEINRAVEVLLEAYREERSVFIFGNGGSAALASHFACDLGKGTVREGALRFRVLSLTDNVPLMTAWANDSRYEDIFAEQVRTFIRSKDIAFAISGSGNSPNVLNAVQVARHAGAFTIGLTGYRGGALASLANLSIIVPSDDMQHIEDLHVTITHSIFRAVREEIFAQVESATAEIRPPETIGEATFEEAVNLSEKVSVRRAKAVIP